MFLPQASFAVEEDIGELLIPVQRRGDVSEELMVVCHTQQGAIHSIYNLIDLMRQRNKQAVIIRNLSLNFPFTVAL